ncbi:MAG: urea carboxylase-associated family protein [Vulcanimicrobiaceae bacterium]
MTYDPASSDDLSPAEYRARYLELKAVALARAHAFGAPRGGADASDELAPGRILSRATVAAGWPWSVRLARGQRLRIVNTSGTPGVSALFWNANDPSERYNAGDTVKVQWNARLATGRLLLSDMGRVLVSLVADTSGLHDTLLGGSTRASVAARLGDGARHPRNTRENFLLAAAKHGLDKRDIAPCVTFFAGVTTTPDDRFSWHDDPAPAGRYVDLRAAMDVLVVLSNCPHPLAPVALATGPIETIVARASADDDAILARYATDEAVRAFENTAASLA